MKGDREALERMRERRVTVEFNHEELLLLHALIALGMFGDRRGKIGRMMHDKICKPALKIIRETPEYN